MTDYLKKHTVGEFSLTSMEEIFNGQDIIRKYYKLIYDKIHQKKPNVFRLDGDIARWAYNDTKD